MKLAKDQISSKGLPQKGRELVLAEPKDSGKTSWTTIFHRLILAGCTVSITNERRFSTDMVTEDTQLIRVDDWSMTATNSD